VAAATQLSIVNRALVLLGKQERLQAVDEGSNVGRAVTTCWDRVLDTVLASHPWNFAVWRAELNQLSDVPPFEYDFYYQLPSDLLRWLPWNDDSDFYFEGEQESDRLLTSAAAPVYIRYIRRVTDLSKWSAGALNELARQMAEELAEVVTAREEILDRMDKETKEATREARKQDGMATGRRNRDAVYRSNWLNSRS
jgi:hypothetical protein